jgi:hypothetical protein
MSRYFFNVVLNGLPSPDRHGREFDDAHAAREHAHDTAVLLEDGVRDHANSFIAVTGPDGRLAFKVPFPEPPRAHEKSARAKARLQNLQTADAPSSFARR